MIHSLWTWKQSFSPETIILILETLKYNGQFGNGVLLQKQFAGFQVNNEVSKLKIMCSIQNWCFHIHSGVSKFILFLSCVSKLTNNEKSTKKLFRPGLRRTSTSSPSWIFKFLVSVLRLLFVSHKFTHKSYGRKLGRSRVGPRRL